MYAFLTFVAWSIKSVSFKALSILDIIGVTETWLSDKIFDNEILPQYYITQLFVKTVNQEVVE